MILSITKTNEFLNGCLATGAALTVAGLSVAAVSSVGCAGIASASATAASFISSAAITAAPYVALGGVILFPDKVAAVAAAGLILAAASKAISVSADIHKAQRLGVYNFI